MRPISSTALCPKLTSSTSGNHAKGKDDVHRMILRHYRGESGEMTQRSREDAIGRREAELLDIAKPRFDAIQAKHVALPDLTDDEAALDVRKKRLLYRSKQRGWLEVDLLLGTWASENLGRLNEKELDEFEAFVNLETIDIYNIVTLRAKEVPVELEENGIVHQIQAWARESPLGKADPGKYEEVKKSNNLI